MTKGCEYGNVDEHLPAELKVGCTDKTVQVASLRRSEMTMCKLRPRDIQEN